MNYVELNSRLDSDYIPEKNLKHSERGTVSLLREKKTGKRYVCHRFTGSGEAYEALRGVNCPNLPGVAAVAQRDGQVLVLEEYVQGDTLAFLLEERPLPEEQAREILIQVCRALKVLHALGVVHRDVKPENIILRGDEVVLIDFDASRVCKPERNADTKIMGTNGYAAPEQYGFSQTDARADIFSLGVLLNEMLIRRHPSGELAAGRLRPIVEKCIEVNMDKRYSSADELIVALNAASPKEKKKRKWWWTPAALVVLFAAVWASGFFERAPGELQADTLQQDRLLWSGDSEVHGTQFRYDLDGDGEKEDYLFAAMYNFVGEPRLLQHSGSAINDKPEVLEVVPAVWVQTGDDRYEPVEEFADLLSDASVNLQKIEGEREADVEDIGTLYGIWPGAIRATFEHEGLWYYECSAALEGETLNAVGSTRTELLDEGPVSVEPYMTAFQYDLDGDGTAEPYWFGAVFQIEDGASPLVRDGTSFYVGGSSERWVAPAVWRETARGKYEQVTEFAPLLKNAQVKLRCVEGMHQPEVDPAEDLFGVWTGTIWVRYTHDGVWVYECSAVVDGTELTAAAVTACETRAPEA